MTLTPKRKGTDGKKSELPLDYLKMVQGVLSTHFDAALKKLSGQEPEITFHASGAVHPDEVVLSVALLAPHRVGATTVHASCDYDPKASHPKAEDLLSTCLDAAGSVWDLLLAQKELITDAAILDTPLAEMAETIKDLPLDWAQTTLEKRKVWLLVDKTNPLMDAMADDWLSKNDPEHRARLAEEQEETSELFVTGKKPPKNGMH